MSSQLYAPDPAVQELLTLKNFEVRVLAQPDHGIRVDPRCVQENFDILEFIGATSDKLITQSKEDSGRTRHYATRY